MKIAITGATGLIGTALGRALMQEGAEVLALTRRFSPPPSSVSTVYWDPVNGKLDPKPLEDIDALVHLAGETIARRWSRAHKERIRGSRVEGTRLLVDALKGLPRKPSVLLSASAVGYYGDRGDEELDESSPSGTSYLPEVCRAWEAEVARASELGIRTVFFRLGLVLSTKGGALAKMLPAFKVGLGGPLGSGRQWVSWIHIDDVVEVFRFALDHSEVEGAVNATAPQPLRQSELAEAVGKALGRPAVFPTPAFALRLAYGEMAQTLLLEGQKVLPRRLEQWGYRFRHPLLSEALEDVLRHRK